MTIKHTQSYTLQLTAFLLLVVFTSFAYYNFHTYKPKSLRQLEEVKGITTKSSVTVPLPLNSTLISESESTNTLQYIFQTTKTENEVADFYRSLYTTGEWELESEGYLNEVFTIKFKSPDKEIHLSASRNIQLEQTFVTLEITDR